MTDELSSLTYSYHHGLFVRAWRRLETTQTDRILFCDTKMIIDFVMMMMMMMIMMMMMMMMMKPENRQSHC